MKDTLNEILKIINDCEEIQNSLESTYTKECAKRYSYEKISELVLDYFRSLEK